MESGSFPKPWSRAALIAVLLLAAALRLPAPDWDGGLAAHPDERFLLGVAQETPLWGDPCAVATDFAYGHLPVYLARAVVLAAPAHDPLFAARLVSGLVGVLLVALAAAWGRALAGDVGALVAALALALAPFPVQLARFYTVDPLGAALASGALLAVTRRRWRAAGALAGLALACKASLAWALVACGGVALLSRRPHPAASPGRRWRRVLGRQALPLVLAAVVAFALAAPWALLRPVACWRGPLIQASMAAGSFDFPYTRQYAGTTPYLYPLAQTALWGLGPGVTLLGLGALLLALWRRRRRCERVAVLWCVGYGLVTAGLYVKFPRYLLPLYPVMCGLAAEGVRWIGRRARWAGALVGAGVLLPTALLGLAQAALYARPHPWIAASRWIYANVPEGATLVVEHWDYPLPVLLAGHPTDVSDVYGFWRVPVLDPPSPEKRALLAQAAREADVIVLASRRGYGALARRPAHYAATLAWYRRVLTERAVLAFGRCPHLGPLALTDDPLADAGLPPPISLAARCGTSYALRLPRLDESFRVYDAPQALLLIRRPD